MPAHLIHDGHILNLEKGDEWFIGRDPDLAEFVIEDPSVSRKHARLSRKESGIFIQNLSDSKSIHIKRADGEKIHLKEKDLSEIPLYEGDQIQIGQSSFVYSEEDISKHHHHKKKDVYDDIFGDLEEPTEPPPPPRQERKQDGFENRDVEKEPLDPTAESKQEDSLYETVWESDADLPYNLLQPATLMLKVISGPNAGAEIGIEKGRSYVIGRDPNSCGVLFNDYSVSHNHAKLHVSADGTMEIEDLGSKNGVLVNGVQVEGKKEITPKDQVSLGTTVFLVIDREMAQDTIYSPMTPYYEQAKSDEESSIADEVVAVVEKEEDWKNKPLPIRHLAMAGSFFAVIFIVFITFFSLFKSNQISEPKKEPSTLVKEALSKYKDVHFSYNQASGKLFLVGHVLTTVDYQEMLYRIGEINFIQSTDNNVVIDELVWKSTNDILSNNSDWRGVSIRSSSAGKFEVVGYVQTNQQAAALSDFLTVNFPYLDRLQNEVVSEETLGTQVQGMLVQHGFGSVAFQLSGNEILLSGTYSNKMKDEFATLLKELNKQPGISKVRNYATPANPTAAGINISQNYQVTGNSTTGGHGYSVILNGKIYEVGSYVDGMEITTIEANTILLEKDGIKYKIEYRQ